MIGKEKNGFVPSAAVLALLAVLAFPGMLLCGCKGGNGEEPEGAKKKPLPAVAVEPARKGPISRFLDLVGEAVAVESVTVAATVEGRIRFCPWREGDRVDTTTDKPATLIEIDRALYRAEVEAARAALDVASAKLVDLEAGTRQEEIAKAREAVRKAEEQAVFAKADLDRVAGLVKSGAMPGEALDKARVAHAGDASVLDAARRHLEMLESGATPTAVAVQEAQVKEAEARLSLAKARLAECVIPAPFSGTITRVHVRAGDMASPRMPLVEMADFSSTVIRIAVPEAKARSLRTGLPARVELDADPGRVHSARIVRVYPALDPLLRTRTAELIIEKGADLLPGMFARVRLILESIPDAVTVPAEAVAVRRDGGKALFVAIEGRVESRKVRTGIEQGGRIQVLEGVEVGEKVVTAGHGKLKDGAEVRIAGKGGPGGGRPGSGGKAPAAGEGGGR
jgi:multidrug efflux pump subunit AcrA (membrane-fusion protein)